MNKYTIDDLKEGMSESFSVSITDSMMNNFLNITQDTNPLHNNVAYAIGKGYKSKVVYGMLTASFLSTLAGVYLPGERSLIHSVNIKMIKPVYIGDELVISGTISEKAVSIPCIVLKVLIRNQNDEIVIRGSMQIGVMDGEK